MSRHRFIKKLDIAEELMEDDDRDYYGKSFDDDAPMSPSTSQFIYRRSRVSSQNGSPIPENDDEDDYDGYGGEEDVFDMDDVSFKPKAKTGANQQKKTAQTQQKPVTKPQVRAKFQVGGNPEREKKALVPAVENLKIGRRETSKSPGRMATSTSNRRLNPVEVAQNIQPSYKPHRKLSTDKTTVNLVIAGHVDSGKSTMVGHLLYQLGNVDERAMRAMKHESARVGKGSFAYAWILDNTEEERVRGVTVDIAHASFETKARRFNILDAPGHRDFIPNMITGAAQADAAVLVVNASWGEFETGFDNGGQTREHALLLRSLGVQHLVVAVNKMDTINWESERYQIIQQSLGQFLQKQAGFNKFKFVPISAFEGINLINAPSPDHPLAAWYKGECLTDTLDNLEIPPQSEDKPLRVIINDVHKSTGNAVVLGGKIDAGFLENGAKVYIMPKCELATVKSVTSAHKEHNQYSGRSESPVCYAGDQVTVSLTGTFEPDSVSPGMVLSRGGNELLLPVQSVTIRLVMFENALPILRGSKADLHCHALRVACTVTKLRSIVNKMTGEVLNANPRVLTKGMSGVVDVHLEKPVCIEEYQKSRTLGRVSLRIHGKTIAAGVVDQVRR